MRGEESVRSFEVPRPKPWAPEELGRCWGDPTTSGSTLDPARSHWHLRSARLPLPPSTIIYTSFSSPGLNSRLVLRQPDLTSWVPTGLLDAPYPGFL